MKEWTIHAVVSEMPVWGQYPLKSTQMMGQWRKNENCLQWYYWKCWDFEQASLSCANAVNNCMTSWNCLGVCVFVVWPLLWVVFFWEGFFFCFLPCRSRQFYMHPTDVSSLSCCACVLTWVHVPWFFPFFSFFHFCLFCLIEAFASLLKVAVQCFLFLFWCKLQSCDWFCTLTWQRVDTYVRRV